MGRPYAIELFEMPETYAWASRCDVSELADAIRAFGDSPLFALGSGRIADNRCFLGNDPRASNR